MRGVFDVGAQDLQPVDFRRQRGGDRGVLLAAPFGDELGGAGGVGLDHRGQLQVGQDAAHLAQRDGVGMGSPDVGDGGALDAEQAVLDALELLADDEQAGVRQQMVDVGDPAGEAVLAGQHAQVAWPSRTASIAASNDRQGRVVIAG